MRAGSVDPCSPGALRSALDWWALAGVDTLAADAPTPWLRSAGRAGASPATVAPVRSPLPAGP
ncbi:MAG: hypothetical protein ACK40H_10035, partial [Sphingomonadaceae bacterium]